MKIYFYGLKMLKLVVVVPGVAGEVAPLHGPHHQEDAKLILIIIYFLKYNLRIANAHV